MKRTFLKTIIFTLIALMVFNTVPPVQANQVEDGFSMKMKNLDKKEQQVILKHLASMKEKNKGSIEALSQGNKKAAKESLGNLEDNLVYADINEGVKSIILGTNDAEVFIAITDDIVEVVEKVGEHEFLINDELHWIEVTVTDVVDLNESSYSSTSELKDINLDDVSIQSTAWILRGSSWVNVNAQRNLDTYSASALGSVVASVLGTIGGVAFWGVTLASLGVGMAYNFVASAAYPTNVGRAHVYRYYRGTSPLTDYRTKSYDYAVYKGNNVYLGISERIKKSCVGCGV